MTNKNKKPTAQPQQQQTGYGPNPRTSPSGGDPRGQSQNQVQYQQQRYESQQGPMAAAMAMNYGRGSEADYGNYTDIMNQYRNIYSGGGDSAGGGGGDGGGGGGGGYSAFTISPERVNAERVAARQLGPMERLTAGNVTAGKLNPLERVKASDPYASYGGYQDFSQTGGFSPGDISNMRARGVSPIRAAYANAERGLQQARSLQGGYSPNAAAAQIKMAREQGQGMADAAQNVEAGIAQQRQAGRLAGLGGMAGIEGQRQQAQMQQDIFNAEQARQGNQFDIGNQMQADQFNVGNRLTADQYNAEQAFQGQQFDIGNQLNADQFNSTQGLNAGQFNSQMDFEGQQYNANAQAQAQAANNAAGAASADRAAQANYQNTQDRLAALSGARTMYGTTPGMTDMFGNQLINAVGQGGNFGLGLMQAQNQGQQLPGRYDQGMNRFRDIYNTGSTIAAPIVDYFQNRNRQQQPSATQQRTASGYFPY